MRPVTDATSPPAIALIVAMARNGVIGDGARIPWHLPDEQQLFKRLTMGHHIVMGRKTYESIGRLLPGRTTVIVTRQAGYAVPGAVIAHTLRDAINAAARDPEIFVIGGAEVFRDALPLAHRLHLTVVDVEAAGDVVMPAIDLAAWRPIASEHHPVDARHAHAFTYTLYERRQDA